MEINQVVTRLEQLLQSLGDNESQLKRIKNEIDKKMRTIVASYAPKTDLLTARREEDIAEITKLYNAHREALTAGGGKTIMLRGGTLSARMTPHSLEISSDKEVEEYLRKKGLWRRFSTQPKRKLSVSALKAAIDVVAAAPDHIMKRVRHENLIINLPEQQIEIVRVIKPLSTRLPE